MRILVACEESQAITIEFRKLGFEAFSCDLLPCSGGHPEWHYQQDVFEVIDKGWDLMIAHPPCTYLRVAGAWVMYNKDGSVNEVRKKNQEDALEELSDLRVGMIDGLPLTSQMDSFIEQLKERPNAIVISGMEMCDYFVVGEWLWI